MQELNKKLNEALETQEQFYLNYCDCQPNTPIKTHDDSYGYEYCDNCGVSEPKGGWKWKYFDVDYFDSENFVKLLECVSLSSHLKGCTAYSLDLHSGFKYYFLDHVWSKILSFNTYLKDKKKEDVDCAHICEYIECNNLLNEVAKADWRR